MSKYNDEEYYEPEYEFLVPGQSDSDSESQDSESAGIIDFIDPEMFAESVIEPPRPDIGNLEIIVKVYTGMRLDAKKYDLPFLRNSYSIEIEQLANFVYSFNWQQAPPEWELLDYSKIPITQELSNWFDDHISELAQMYDLFKKHCTIQNVQWNRTIPLDYIYFYFYGAFKEYTPLLKHGTFLDVRAFGPH